MKLNKTVYGLRPQDLVRTELLCLVAHLDATGNVDQDVYEAIIKVTLNNCIRLLEGKGDDD